MIVLWLGVAVLIFAWAAGSEVPGSIKAPASAVLCAIAIFALAWPIVAIVFVGIAIRSVMLSWRA